MKKFLLMALLGCTLVANAEIKDVNLLFEQDGGDIYEQVMEEVGSDTIGNLAVMLYCDAKISQTLKVFGDVEFNTISDVTIDASELTGPMVATIDTTLTEWKTVTVNFANLKIKGLAQPMFTSGAKNYLYESFTVSNCYVEVAKDTTVFDFTKGGYPYIFSIDQSTFYAPSATQSAFISTQGGQKATEGPDSLKQSSTFSFTQSTLYNLTYNKNFISHRQKGVEWLNFILENCVVINCGKANFLASLNGGQNPQLPKYTVNNNSIGTLIDGVYTDLSVSQDTTVTDSTTVYFSDSLVLPDAANGEFYLDESTAQFTNNIGDPRWLYPTSYDLDVTLPSGTDISQALADSLAASGKGAFNDVLVTLEKGGTYTVSKGTAVLDWFAIQGEGATIDASALEEPMATLVPNNTGIQKEATGIFFSDVKITGLKQSLVASGTKDYYLSLGVGILESVIEVAADTTTIDFTKGSLTHLFVYYSTIYAPEATKSSFFSSQLGQKASEFNLNQYFIFKNNTLYNLAFNKNFISHRQSGQTWLGYGFENNIVVNCGKPDFLASLNGGQKSTFPTYDVDKNLICTIVDGVFTDLSDQQYKEVYDTTSVVFYTQNPGFKDLANADFTLSDTAEVNQKAGDPRWWVEPSTESIEEGATETKPAGNGISYNLSGQAVGEGYKGIVIRNGRKVVVR